jgi:UDP-N-acetylglucosamine 2-epimerase (non-hydrolysing)
MDSDKKIAIIVGTRPEIIKMASIIECCRKKKLNHFIIHTGQHYSYNMDKVFFEELQLPEPEYKLNIKSSAAVRQGEHTGKMLQAIEDVYLKEKPNIALTEGDTNTVLAASLAAIKLYIKLGHVEAGLRSFDKTMPEETNRTLADHMSNFLFAPTETAKRNLIYENLAEEKIFVTGNTVVDCVFKYLEIAKKKFDMLEKLKLEKDKYILVTVHRQENVDDSRRLKNILTALDKVQKKFKLQVIYPMHPRTKKMIDYNNYEIPKSITIIEPVGYFEFLQLEANARMTMTDSGGVQEESCVFQVPCVTLRDNTERPETVEAHSNIIAGTNPDKVLHSAEIMMNSERNWKQPFGDGKAGQRVVDVVLRDTTKMPVPRWVLEGVK